MPFNKENMPSDGKTCVTKEEMPEAFQPREGTIEAKGLLHVNGNLLCSLGVLTTGKRADIFDIIQICILPLDSYLAPMKGVMPFYTDIAPRRGESYYHDLPPAHKGRARTAAKIGLDSNTVEMLLYDWFDKLKLPATKKLYILTHDWPKAYLFLTDWLGPVAMEQIFDEQYRDIQPCASFMNDLNDFHGNRPEFGRVALSSIARFYDLTNEYKDDMLQRTQTIAETYRRMVKAS